MMNRRGFLKFLGLASVGATVAYSFPSIIVPKNIIGVGYGFNTFAAPIPENLDGVLTYEKLLKAYNTCRNGAVEPDLIVLSKTQYEHLIERLAPQFRYTGANNRGTLFHGALVMPSEHLTNDVIKVQTYGDLVRDDYFDINKL